MSGLWKKVERVGVENFPIYLEDDDICYYARDYISKGGFQASKSNDLINNFKKPADRKGKPEWRYKKTAMQQFAKELSDILPDGILVTCMPSSISKTDSNYDSRLEDTLQQLRKTRPNIIVEFPISVKQTTLAAHSGANRDPNQIYRNLEWKGIQISSDKIVLIDDVLTTGAHFKACQRLIWEHCPGIDIIGVFWAKTVWL